MVPLNGSWSRRGWWHLPAISHQSYWHGCAGAHTRRTRNLLRPCSSSRLDSSHQTHFPGLFRRARLRELISRAYLAELIDPNSADNVVNSSFNSSEPDVHNSSSEDAIKTSSTNLTKTYSTRLPKTYSQDDLRMSYRDLSTLLIYVTQSKLLLKIIGLR